jgi:hypothetical protein
MLAHQSVDSCVDAKIVVTINIDADTGESACGRHQAVPAEVTLSVVQSLGTQDLGLCLGFDSFSDASQVRTFDQSAQALGQGLSRLCPVVGSRTNRRSSLTPVTVRSRKTEMEEYPVPKSRQQRQQVSDEGPQRPAHPQDSGSCSVVHNLHIYLVFATTYRDGLFDADAARMSKPWSHVCAGYGAADDNPG